MAKTPNLKKNRVNTSIRSRAARRKLESPPPGGSIAVPSSLHDETPSVLGPHQSGGITKKQSRSKVLSRKQRLRVEAGREKGENTRERTSAKIVASVGKSQRRNNRRRDWDEMNQSIQKDLEGASRQKLSSGTTRAQLNAAASSTATTDGPDQIPTTQPVRSVNPQKLAEETAELSLNESEAAEPT